LRKVPHFRIPYQTVPENQGTKKKDGIVQVQNNPIGGEGTPQTLTAKYAAEFKTWR